MADLMFLKLYKEGFDNPRWAFNDRLEYKKLKIWYKNIAYSSSKVKVYQVLFLDYKASIDPPQREYLMKFRYDKYATMDDKFTATVVGALTLIFLVIVAGKFYLAWRRLQ